MYFTVIVEFSLLFSMFFLVYYESVYTMYDGIVWCENDDPNRAGLI